MSTLNAKVILNVKTAAEWANSMEILLEGELGIESDTRLIKIGNGVDTYINLPYTAASDINDIEGVTVTNPTDGNVLTYSNGEWVNITPSSLPADTDLSHYDNTTSGFITASDIPALPADTDLSHYDNTNSDFATVSQIPTDVSQLNNDAGYITSASIPSVGDGTITIQKNSVNVDSFTTNQNTNKTINITVPTLLSELSNDVGYITSATLPTVNDATLTIQRNGTTVGTFTANAATNSTINISVPTSFSDITSAGDLLPSIDATYNLGSSSYRWSTGYINTIESTNINTANSKITGALTVGIPSDVAAYKRITIKGYDGNTEGTLTDWAWLGYVTTGVFGFRPITTGTGTIGTTDRFWSKGYFNNLCATDIYSKYNPFTHLSSVGLYYNTHVIEELPAVQWGTMGQKSASEIGIFPEINNAYLGSSTSYWTGTYSTAVHLSSNVHLQTTDGGQAGEFYWYNTVDNESAALQLAANCVQAYSGAQAGKIDLGNQYGYWRDLYLGVGRSIYFWGGSSINDTTGNTLDFHATSQCRFYLNNEESIYLGGGQFTPTSSTAYDLGNSTKRWNTVWYTTLNPPSDIRLKENVEPLDSGLNIVNALDIKSFTFKNSPDHIEYGIIAQDVVEKYPELISVPNSEDGTYGTYLHNFIFVSLRAIQELSSKVDELNAKIEVLEGRA